MIEHADSKIGFFGADKTSTQGHEPRFEYEAEHQAQATAALSNAIDQLESYHPEKHSTTFTDEENAAYSLLALECLKAIHEYARSYGISDDADGMALKLEIAWALHLQIRKSRNPIAAGLSKPSQLRGLIQGSDEITSGLTAEEKLEFMKLADKSLYDQMANAYVNHLKDVDEMGSPEAVRDFFEEDAETSTPTVFDVDEDELPPPPEKEPLLPEEADFVQTVWQREKEEDTQVLRSGGFSSSAERKKRWGRKGGIAGLAIIGLTCTLVFSGGNGTEIKPVASEASTTTVYSPTTSNPDLSPSTTIYVKSTEETPAQVETLPAPVQAEQENIYEVVPGHTLYDDLETLIGGHNGAAEESTSTNNAVWESVNRIAADNGMKYDDLNKVYKGQKLKIAGSTIKYMKLRIFDLAKRGIRRTA